MSLCTKINVLRQDIREASGDPLFDLLVPVHANWALSGYNTLDEVVEVLSWLESYLELKVGIADPDIQGSPYPLDPQDHRLHKFEAREIRLFQEALLCFKVEAYTGAIALCGTVAESLVERACKSRALSGDSFGAKVKALRSEGVLKQQYNSLVGVVTTYRNLAAHPSDELFNREKANVVIGATLVLLEEVF